MTYFNSISDVSHISLSGFTGTGMKQLDPIFLRSRTLIPHLSEVHAQTMGNAKRQEDTIGNYLDEFYVLADGAGETPHGDMSSKLAVETAIWGYKLIRQRRYYWTEKDRLVYRIFRSVNICLWQKRREDTFTEGLATTLACAILGNNKIWIGSSGDSRIFLIRNGEILVKTEIDRDQNGRCNHMLGVDRYGIMPHIYVIPYHRGDTVVFTSDGVTDYISDSEIQVHVTEHINDLKICADYFIKEAGKRGSKQNATALIVHRMT